jgi:hypothetical protein
MTLVSTVLVAYATKVRGATSATGGDPGLGKRVGRSRLEDASNPAADSRRKESPIRDARTVEGRLLQWGGLAGVAGAALFTLTFAVVIGFGLPDPGDPRALVRFPDIRFRRDF